MQRLCDWVEGRSINVSYIYIYTFHIPPDETSVPEQLNTKAVTGACKLIDGCSLELCSATPSVASSGICHRHGVNSVA